jgi:hypothetical protein
MDNLEDSKMTLHGSTLNWLSELHHDQRGDVPVGPILVIGLIAIPLVIALVVFRDEMLEYMRARLDDFTGANTDASL